MTCLSQRGGTGKAEQMGSSPPLKCFSLSVFPAWPERQGKGGEREGNAGCDGLVSPHGSVGTGDGDSAPSWGHAAMNVPNRITSPDNIWGRSWKRRDPALVSYIYIYVYGDGVWVGRSRASPTAGPFLGWGCSHSPQIPTDCSFCSPLIHRSLVI